MPESATKVKWNWRTGREDMQSYDGATGEPFASIYCDDPNGKFHLGERLPETVATVFGADCKARARMMAASPDLLDALNRMLISFAGMDEELCIECGEKSGTGKTCDTCYVIGMAMAAVEKAVGAEIE